MTSELKDTIPLMTSDSYVARFQAEYWQTRIRYEKLKQMIQRYLDRTLPFVPRCPIEILRGQQNAMGHYLNMLETRARVEKIDLEEFPTEEEENDEPCENRHGSHAEDRGQAAVQHVSGADQVVLPRPGERGRL